MEILMLLVGAAFGGVIVYFIRPDTNTSKGEAEERVEEAPVEEVKEGGGQSSPVSQPYFSSYDYEDDYDDYVEDFCTPYEDHYSSSSEDRIVEKLERRLKPHIEAIEQHTLWGSSHPTNLWGPYWRNGDK